MHSIFVIFFIFCLKSAFLQKIPSPAAQSSANRSFRIDFDKNTFLKDDKPFQFVAGALHYFRVPKVYWRDRLRKYRAAGLNVVTTYVEWSYHEPLPRSYDFNGDKDLECFIELAAEEDLLVILRPGPYIDAERDFGGFPPWLMSLYPQIELRTNDENYKTEVKIWFDLLLAKMQKYLYGKGGPIIMVQVENEYGSYYACDSEYKIWLRDLMLKYIKNDAILFTIDGGYETYLKCGTIPDVYATIDFGADVNVTYLFENLREYQKKGPLVTSEFYVGWFSSWGKPRNTKNTESILRTMQQMLALNASFNLYMFFGGTSFGFTNGAYLVEDRYSPQLTSYDFDSPLDEAGDPTDKYFAIRKLLSQYFKLPDIPVPKPTLKGNYGTVTLKPILSLFNHSQIPDRKEQSSEKPLTFEQMKVYYGYILYETKLPDQLGSEALLRIDDLRDRSNVFIDQAPQGIFSRTKLIRNITVVPKPDGKLQLLVENQGRICKGRESKDMKGIISTPTINGKSLTEWKMVGLPFSDVSWVEMLVPGSQKISPPAYYYGELVLPASSSPLHTYVDLTGWVKGVIFINGHNLGRYWPDVGPQVTLFVPASYLNPAPLKNKIVVFETERAPQNFQIKFTDIPNLNKTTPL